MTSVAAGSVWVHCNECGRETKHEPVHTAARRREFREDKYPVDVGSTWNIYQCRGCEEVTMQRFDWCSEDDPFDGPNDRIYFPARVSRRKPSWSSSAPGAYVGLLGEVYAALHADSRRLAMMGARALIDSVITRSVGEQKTFALGLEELHKQEFIATKERKVIEAAVEAGHAAMHRGHQPTAEDVNVVIDIVERMIHAEILKAQADALKASTPPRKTQSATKKT